MSHFKMNVDFNTFTHAIWIECLVPTSEALNAYYGRLKLHKYDNIENSILSLVVYLHKLNEALHFLRNYLIVMGCEIETHNE